MSANVTDIAKHIPHEQRLDMRKWALQLSVRCASIVTQSGPVTPDDIERWGRRFAVFVETGEFPKDVTP